MLDINKCKLVPGVTFWGEIAGNIETQSDLMSKLSTYATEAWVNEQGFLSSVGLSSYATKSWVGDQGYLTSTNLSGYATESYVTTALSGYATQSWVESQGYLTSHQDLSSYATMSWVGDQGYLTSTNLSGYATESYVTTALSGYATESWVTSQSYALNADLLSLTSRVSDIESTLGTAISITNNILS